MNTGRTATLRLNLLVGLLLVGLLAGCGSQPSSAGNGASSQSATASRQSIPTPAVTQPIEENTATPASPIAAQFTATPKPTRTPRPQNTPTVEVNWLEVSSKTEHGRAYLGNPDAPVTVVNYADFM
jgi:protein-disulfide isomerase